MSVAFSDRDHRDFYILVFINTGLHAILLFACLSALIYLSCLRRKKNWMINNKKMPVVINGSN